MEVFGHCNRKGAFKWQIVGINTVQKMEKSTEKTRKIHGKSNKTNHYLGVFPMESRYIQRTEKALKGFYGMV